MKISYFDPLSAGWNRMKNALFYPFDIRKWFIVGFTAFLAGLMDYNGGGGGNAANRDSHPDLSWHDFRNAPAEAWDWLLSHSVIFTLIIIGVIFLIGIIITLTWLSSRGKFMFLHNVIHDKSDVGEPWKAYSREGNSLFIWRLVFGLIASFVITGFMVIAFATIIGVVAQSGDVGTNILVIMAFIFTFLAIIIVVSYISLFLNDFIVPVMFKNKVSATKGWGIFLKLLSRHPGPFILYGLFRFLLALVVLVCILIFGFFTCCIGFIILLIPYISSVLLLPVSYTFRAFSVEFLEQFGDDYTFFPEQPVTDGP